MENPQLKFYRGHGIINIKKYINDALKFIHDTQPKLCLCEECEQKRLTLKPKPNTTKNMKSTLATAVLVTIDEFHDKQKSFSAWDITNELRRKVNSGDLYISDLPAPEATYEGQYINHDKVRQQVHELFAANLIPDYKADDGIASGRGYVLYTFQTGVHDTSTVAKTALTIPTVIGPSKPPVTQPQPTNRAWNSPLLTNSVTAKVTVTSPSVQSNKISLDELSKYIKSQKAKGIYPSLKRIQSRFKRKPETCAEIRALVLKAGYNVKWGLPDAPSTDYVV